MTGRSRQVENGPLRANMAVEELAGDRLSVLQRFILVNVQDGVERGELLERYYGLERRYRGWWTDPCLRGRAERRYQRRYRRAQVAMTKALKRLERRGLVELVAPRRYVKEVRLTAKGRAVAAAVTAAAGEMGPIRREKEITVSRLGPNLER